MPEEQDQDWDKYVVKTPPQTEDWDKYAVKKKDSPSPSSAGGSKLASQFQEYANTLPSGSTTTKVVNKPVNPKEDKATVIGGEFVQPVNLPKGDRDVYAHKTKVKEAAINTLKKNYAQTGQKFDEKSPNVQKYIKQVEQFEKDADVGVVDGRDGKPYIVRGAGFGESLANTTKESFEAPVKAWEINTIRDPKALADKLDGEMANTPNVPESVPTGISGGFGSMAGGVVKPAALLSLNAVTGGLGTAAMVAEGHFTARANQIRQLYQRGLNEGKDRVTAANEAMHNADLAALPDDVMNFMLAEGGIKNPFKNAEPIIGKLPDETFRKYLKATGEKVAKMSGAGGVAEGVRGGIEKTQGYDVGLGETLEKMYDGASEWGKMELGFRLIHGVANAPKYLKSAAKEYVTNVPPEIREEYLSRLPEQDAAKIQGELKSYEEARKQVDGLVPEQDISTYAGLVEKRNALEKEKEGKSKALTEPIDEFIKDIDDRLSRMQKTGKVNEVDDITGEPVEPVKTHEELSKKEREGIIVPKEYGDTEVIEVGEGENKKYKARATYKKGDGRIMTSHDIEMEGKEYTDKDKAQAAADEALAKHYYENGMAEHDKPLASKTKTEEPLTTTPSTELTEEEKLYGKKEDRVKLDNTPGKRIIEPSKPIAEMNSEELSNYANDYRKALKAQDKQFEGKTEEEKQAGRYNDVRDEVENIRDAVTRVNFVENSENISDLANSVKSTLSNMKDREPNEYELSILNAAKNKATELGIEPQDLIKEIASKVANQFKDIEDAELMVKATLEKLIPKNETTQDTKQETKGQLEPEKLSENIDPTSEGEKIEPPNPPTEPPVVEGSGKKEPEFGNKAILKRLSESENIKPEIRDKFKEDLKYKVKSHEEARTVAKEVINEYGHEESVSLAEAGKFHGDVNSMIFGEALDQLYKKEKEAKTPEEKIKYATQWADVAMRYDEAARSGGRFISAIGDFYKKSPLGIQLKEETNRSEHFKDWFKDKEKGFKEVFEAIKEEPEFKEIISKEVQEQLKKERTEARSKRRKNIDDFFEGAKFKGDANYATLIPPNVINGGLEAMKQAFLAGESVVAAVEKAIDHISESVKDWDKEKFRKEYEEKLRSIEGKGSKLSEKELSEQKKERILERFRKKLKGLSDKEKEEIIRKSFKKLVENGALEYAEFKKIIADTLGLGELSEAEKAKIEKYVQDINAVDDAAQKARTDRTQASLDAYFKASKLAERSSTELGEIVYNKPSIINRLTSIMQLNTLGIPSLVNNPVFNIVNQSLVRFPKAVQLSILDKMIQLGGKAFGKDIKPNNNVVAAQIPFFKGVGSGAKQSIEQLFTGLTNKDYFQKEVHTSQIKPWTSIKELWQWGKGNKHLTKAQIVDKALQGTIGAPAEVVARTLNIGDKPQRFATEKATAKVIANQYGLKGMDEKLFMEFPKQEAYLLEKKKGLSDDAAMKKAEEIEKRIIGEGEESTFQQDNFVNQALTAIGQAYDKVAEGNAPMEFAGKMGKIFKTMNLPFVKIPMNAFWSYFNLVNPEIAMMQSIGYGASAAYKKAKGIDGAAKDFEQSKKWMAHATTGMGLLALSATLASKGIVSGDNNADDTKKEREGEKFYEQQHAVDMGKLNAWLHGRNPDEVKDGLKVDLKWFGVLGNAANLQANKYEKMDETKRKEGIKVMGDMLGDLNKSALEVFETGVFSNASSMANALNRGGAYSDSYLTNLINMASNTVHPAMFAQVSRAKLPYDYTTKADSFGEQIKNNMSARSDWGRKLFNKYPPSKIGIWGDELKRNDDWALRWFGMSHTNKDAFAKPLYDDYKKTGDVKFFPPSVKPEIDKQKLNTAEARQLETLVGQARQKLVAPFINDAATLPGYDEKYSKLSKEDKISALEILYEEGYKQGKEQFQMIHPKYASKETDWNSEEIKSEKKSIKNYFKESLKQ